MGQRTIDMELDDGATVADAVAEVVRRYPTFSPEPAQVVVAVNREYVSHSHPLADGDEAAFIPPVSGG